MAEYLLPDVGEGLTEAEVVTWRVAVGDVVAVNDVVCEIETAKSIVELPSPYAGVVSALLVPVGKVVPVGTPLIRIGDAAEPAPALAPTPPAEPVAEAIPAPEVIPVPVPEAPPAAAPPAEKQALLVGYGPAEEATGRRARRTTSPATVATPIPAASTRALAAPAVRRLARDLGIDLSSVVGTGPDGRVEKADLLAALAPAAANPVPALPPVHVGPQDTVEPIKGVRKAMAQAMVASAFTAPHVTEWMTVDVTRTVEFVESLKRRSQFADLKVSPLVIVAYALSRALPRHPLLNSVWDEAGDRVVLRGDINLGIAAATPRGLVVPVIRNADRLGVPELAAELRTLAVAAREGKTQPDDMVGGTFTITNVGVFGVDSGTPIINPGQAAIMAVGAIRKQPWVVTDDEGRDEVAIRHLTTLALSFDHRHIDGAAASEFLADVAGLLEHPAALVLG